MCSKSKGVLSRSLQIRTEYMDGSVMYEEIGEAATAAWEKLMVDRGLMVPRGYTDEQLEAQALLNAGIVHRNG